MWNLNPWHFLRLNGRRTKVPTRNVVGNAGRLQEIIEQAKVIIIILGLHIRIYSYLDSKQTFPSGRIDYYTAS